MNVGPIASHWTEIEADCVALGIFEEESAPPILDASPLSELVRGLFEAKEISGGLGELTPLHGVAGIKARTVMLLGLGRKERCAAAEVFAAGVALSKRLSSRPRESVAVAVPAEAMSHVDSLVSGLVVGTRDPGLRKSKPSRTPFGALWIVVDPKSSETERAELSAQISRGEILGNAVNLARNLANTPAAEKAPTVLANLARTLASEVGIEVEVWDHDRIKTERFGGLLGVAAGSEEPPAFVVLNYHKGGDAPHLAIVGKGVTFDSGGLSLKPSASMEDMKCDMTGAAVTLAAMIAVARLNLPVNLRGYLALTENMTGGRAMKLGDVLTMRNGKTVEVLNTDAEGRLILADALSYAVENGPERVINLATLTGACLVALGTNIAGLFSNDDSFADDVVRASRASGEPVWRLPLDEEIASSLKSSVADIKNVGGKWGGAILAAKFLEEFVGKTPWVHLDIAGPSWATADSATRDQGGTGCFVRALVALAEERIPSGSTDTQA